MRRFPWPRGLTASAFGLAMLAAGCGGLEEATPAKDSGSAGDVPAPMADGGADGWRPSPDLGLPDARDTGASEAAWPEAGGETAAVDAMAALDATEDGPGRPEVPPPPAPATVVILPDTQYYASSRPEVFTQQTTWIVAQRPALNIAAVLHVGDVVDGDTPTQWTNASTSLRLLDGLVPYVLVPGNHDTDGNRKTRMNDYFGPTTMPWITDTMVDGRIENSYALLDIGPVQWLVLGLEFGPRDTVVAWADTVLKAYPTTPAMLVTHAYLYHDGTRYDAASPSPQLFLPQGYNFTPSEGINDGEMLWQKLVLPNPNVRMVFSGHDTGWARLSSARPDGSVVHQMLSDYQWWGESGTEFGFGWLRVLRLDYARRTIHVQTYSPYLQSYLTDPDNQFSLPWNL